MSKLAAVYFNIDDHANVKMLKEFLDSARIRYTQCEVVDADYVKGSQKVITELLKALADNTKE